MQTFRNAAVGALCALVTALLVVVVVSPATYGEWRAKVEAAQTSAMDDYWCDIYECDAVIDEHGEIHD